MRAKILTTVVAMIFCCSATAATAGNSAKICTEIYQPVCGYKDEKWKTYPNKCEAENSMVSQIKSGKCNAKNKSNETMCPLIWLPVCGKLNGVETTFANDCVAKVAGAKDIVEGECKTSNK